MVYKCLIIAAMEEKTSSEPSSAQRGDLTPEEPTIEEPTLLSRNLVSLIVGFVVVALIIGGGVYWFLTNRTKLQPQLEKVTPTPMATPSAQPSPTQQTQSVQWNVYKNTPFRYQLKIPANWESFVRIDLGTSQQVGFRPSGSTDVPITVNAQPNPQTTLDEIVNTQLGVGYPREQKTVAGRQALVVRNTNAGYVSYFLVTDTTLYEFSAALSNNYPQTLEQILITLTIR